MHHNHRQSRALFTISLLSALAAGSVMAAAANDLPQWKIIEDQAMELTGGAREHKLNEALSEAKQYNQPDGYPQSECLFELGVYFTDIGKTAQAEKYFFEAADLKNAALHNSLFGQEVKEDKLTHSPIVFLPAYSDAKAEHQGKVHDLANCLSWLGRAYTAEKKYEEAEDVFGKALALLDTSKDPDHESILLPETLLRAAKVERLLNHLNEAKKMEEKACYILHNRHALDR
jgi:tetratricopeptide (TPR) repeat protein